MLERLKKRWKVNDNWQFAVIFLVFAITGSSAAKITGPLLKFFDLFKDMNPWGFNVIYGIATLVFYQFLLVFFGWLFGEFDFFYNFVKKILRSLGMKFLGKAI